ncbi:DUF3871 family protein [Maribellus mangrovi]|uniref:DUF3871 family protein n=1 Tax=Maribellus mangrovi TaxID=3133146 RepID=UPI0030EB604D
MNLVPVNPVVEEAVLVDEQQSTAQFIEANTITILPKELKNGCIIPVFSKDNESTISHTEFVEATYEVTQQFFPQESLLKPNIRVSHPIKGRIPEAMGKPAKELSEAEKTLYFERMAFVIEVPSIAEDVHGNTLSLSVGGVRAYNHENLYNKKSEEKFKVFVGFKNKVCTNLCVFTDGAYQEIKVRSINELAMSIYKLLSEFEPARMLQLLRNFGNYELPEHLFAQLLGKARMYQYLPAKQKKTLQAFPLGDAQVGAIAREYYNDESFSRKSDGSIDLWRLYNLFTGANKSSYIDTFLDRGAGCFSFTQFLAEHLESGSNSWYLGN